MKLQDEIRKAFEELMQVARKAQDKKNTAEWIAYNIGWGMSLIRWYEAGLKGEMPEMPGEGFSKWDYTGIKKHFHKKYWVDGCEEQLKVFEEVVERIIEIVQNEEPSLEVLGKWEWCTLPSGKQWTLEKWIRVNTVSPYKRAAREIRTCKSLGL